jgi:protein-disulfide isomerase
MEEKPLTKKEKRALAKEEKRQKKARKKLGKVMAIFAVLGAVAFGVYYFGFRPKPAGESPKDRIEITEQDHIKGSPEASVTVVEFSDFQCPACATYFPVVSQLSGEMGDDLQLVYKHFPLTTSHPNALSAAWAAEAAGRQDKFWEMHDLLFSRQADWSSLKDPLPKFKEYAQELELDGEKFQADLEDEGLRDKVKADSSQAIKLGVNATPTFFVNGKKITNPRSYDAFAKLIRDRMN